MPQRFRYGHTDAEPSTFCSRFTIRAIHSGGSVYVDATIQHSLDGCQTSDDIQIVAGDGIQQLRASGLRANRGMRLPFRFLTVSTAVRDDPTDAAHLKRRSVAVAWWRVTLVATYGRHGGE